MISHRPAESYVQMTKMTMEVVRQYLTAGHLDELLIHIAPVLLGGGVRLLDGESRAAVGLEQIRVAESPGVTHLTYRVVR